VDHKRSNHVGGQIIYTNHSKHISVNLLVFSTLYIQLIHKICIISDDPSCFTLLTEKHLMSYSCSVWENGAEGSSKRTFTNTLLLNISTPITNQFNHTYSVTTLHFMNADKLTNSKIHHVTKPLPHSSNHSWLFTMNYFSHAFWKITAILWPFQFQDPTF
jgi:hypothetical protein